MCHLAVLGFHSLKSSRKKHFYNPAVSLLVKLYAYMTFLPSKNILPMLGFVASFTAVSQSHAEVAITQCLSRELETASDAETLGEVRERCNFEQNLKQHPDATPPSSGRSIVDERLRHESAVATNPWVITPHRPNYLLPLTYNSSVNNAPFESFNEEFKTTEVKFQISFKFPVIRNLFSKRAHVFFAYTNQSYWQLYSENLSSPFRETSHEPEIFLLIRNDWEIFGWRNSAFLFGYLHQSNGRPVPLSRSWNRLYATFVFDRGNWLVSFKPWLRIWEKDKTDPLEADGDDNPDILDFMGYAETRLMYKKNNRVFTIMSRNNLSSDGLGAIELTYSFTLYANLKGYVQYFNGYGESLIDYNARSNRIGIGIAISDWL